MKYFFKKIFKKPKKAEKMGEVFTIDIPFNSIRTSNEKYERIFKPSKKLIEWTKKHQESCKSTATGGEQFEWSFSPSSIVEVQKAKCLICGEKCIDYVD